LFSGVSGDAYCLAQIGGSGSTAQIWPLCLVDLPLSLAADVLVSPYKAYDQIAHGNYHPRCDPGRSEKARELARRKLQAMAERCRSGQAQPPDDCTNVMAPDWKLPDDVGGPCPPTMTGR